VHYFWEKDQKITGVKGDGPSSGRNAPFLYIKKNLGGSLPERRLYSKKKTSGVIEFGKGSVGKTRAGEWVR